MLRLAAAILLAALPLFAQTNDASALDTAGTAELQRGQYAAALDLYLRALEVDRRQGDRQGEAVRLGHLGNAYFFQGKYLDAQEQYEAALRGVEQREAEPWAVARRPIALTNLAILYEQLGGDQQAADTYRRALDAGGTPADRGQVFSRLGGVYRRMGDTGKALDAYDAARQTFAHAHLADGEIHALEDAGIAFALGWGAAPRAARSFDDAVKLAETGRNPREIALAHLCRGEYLFRANDLSGAAREFQAALSDAEEAWTALHGMARVARRQGDAPRALARLREAIAIIETVGSGRANPSLKPGFLADKRDVYDAAIGLMLDAGTRDPAALLPLFEQARTGNLRDAWRGFTVPPALAAVQRRLPEGGALVEYWIGDGRLAALWITRNASGTEARSWSWDDAQAVFALYASLRTAQDAAWREPAAVTGASLLNGVPWDAIRRVLIVPDGVLYLVPFEALPVHANGPLLMERMAVTYLPSAALLFRDQPVRSALAPWRPQLAAFGSGSELRAIGRGLPGRVVLYEGSRNVKQRVAGDVPLLHLAAPAVVDAADSNRSRIPFSPQPGSQGSAWMFRTEAQALPLEGTDLVTLPACDTEARGPAIQAFSRAFLAAGARSTVTTLWRVEDRATADLMRWFYEGLGRDLTKADALRAAKLRFLLERGPRALPQFWAAFVLTGDGDSPVRPVLPWSRVVLVGGLVTVGLVVVWRRRR